MSANRTPVGYRQQRSIRAAKHLDCIPQAWRFPLEVSSRHSAITKHFVYQLFGNFDSSVGKVLVVLRTDSPSCSFGQQQERPQPSSQALSPMPGSPRASMHPETNCVTVRCASTTAPSNRSRSIPERAPHFVTTSPRSTAALPRLKCRRSPVDLRQRLSRQMHNQPRSCYLGNGEKFPSGVCPC